MKPEAMAVLVLLNLLAPAGAWARSVTVNGVAVAQAQLDSLEKAYQVGIADGSYWYDKLTGGWGLQGGAQRGLVVPGLDLGGPLRADASGGGTGVFVNGRELHPLDVQFLQSFMPVYPGRYWVDAYGNGGLEGGPLAFNLVQLAQQAQRKSKGGPWSSYKDWGASNSSMVSDVEGGFYFSVKDTATGKYTTDYSTGP